MAATMGISVFGGYGMTVLADGETEIEFLYYADDTQKAIIESACAAYEESHPGIQIKQTVIPAEVLLQLRLRHWLRLKICRISAIWQKQM